MPRKNLKMDGGIGGQCNKVRKRGNSSSSSSSLVRNYRLKRAILIGKRGGGGGGEGSTTPVPMWKMSSKSPYYNNNNSSSSLLLMQNEKKYLLSAKEMSVSARKLAATLWEINGGLKRRRRTRTRTFVKNNNNNNNNNLEEKEEEEEEEEQKIIIQETETGDDKKEKILEYSSNLEEEEEEALMALCWSESDPSSLLVPEGRRMMDRPDVLIHRRRSSTNSQKILRSYECNIGGGGGGSASASAGAGAGAGAGGGGMFFNSLHSGMEVDPNQMLSRSSHGKKHKKSSSKNHLKDLMYALTTSKELLKVLTHIWHADEQQPTSLSLISAMKVELDRACIQVSKLIHDQKEFDLLVHHLNEEKTAWKMKEKERVRTAIATLVGDLEIEKKLKRQTERLNKKLGLELADTKAKLMSSLKELECEKRAREILEQVCDELATGIGEDRAKVEELKRESDKVREEVEKEREMLQLADVLREERVQMKLSEAKYQFEEKNAVVDKLRTELESYLKNKISSEKDQVLVDGSPNYAKIKELEQYLRETLPIPSEYKDQENVSRLSYRHDQEHKEEEEDDDDDDDSADSDLHSIELNMDENSKSYKWSDDVHQEISKKKTKVRKSTSDKRQRQSICIQRQTSDGIEWEFSPNPADILDDNDDDVGRKPVFEFSSKTCWGSKECEDEIERYNMIKNLRDHIVSGSRMVDSSSTQEEEEVVSNSPNENWNKHILPTQNSKRMACEGFTVLQEAV